MTMSEQIVTFPAEANDKVGQYCIDHSVPLPGYFKEHKDYTEQNVANPSTCPQTPHTHLDVFLTHLACRWDGVNTPSTVLCVARQRPQGKEDPGDRMFLWYFAPSAP